METRVAKSSRHDWGADFNNKAQSSLRPLLVINIVSSLSYAPLQAPSLMPASCAGQAARACECMLNLSIEALM